MVSDQELSFNVEILLRQSDPNAVTSLNGVVQQLESKLGFDLSHKVGFIRDQIDRLLRSHTQFPSPTDHFALQNYPQFPNYHPQVPPYFSVQPHLKELNFQGLPRFPQPEVPPLQSQNVVTPTNSGRRKESAPTVAKRRGGPGGLNKACGVSPELQAIVGEPTMSRTEIVKQLWAYIRKNNLQDPSNKRKIICDDPLRLVFETDSTDMFKMNKLISKHIFPLEPPKESVPHPKRLKVDTECIEKNTTVVPPPVIVSDALAKFFGSGEREMLQAEAIRRVWEHIKVNHLEDPINSETIICDSKLQELFGCESISSLEVSEMVAHHLSKQS